MAAAIETQDTVARALAQEAGEKFYTPRNPCKKGHRRRYVSNNACAECTRLQAQQSGKRGTKISAEDAAAKARAAAAGERYYVPKKPCGKGHQKRYVSNDRCSECATRNSLRWKAENKSYQAPPPPDRASAKAEGLVTYYSSRPCRHGHGSIRFVSSGKCVECWRNNYKATRETVTARLRRRRHEYPAVHRAILHRRRARKHAAGGRYTATEIQQLFAKQSGRCIYCTRSLRRSYHIDHKVPLAKGGSNAISNIQLLCEGCNLRKNAKDPVAFARENGFLVL